jgi:hypothetical protein
MRLQVFFFKQDLAMKYPRAPDDVGSKYPVWKNQELANQNNRKRHIDGIATEGKNAGGNQCIGMVSINANPEALPKRN